jgi:glycosyltransferase 2 family protein
MKRPGSVLLLSLLKLAITAALIVFIVMKVDFSTLLRHLNERAAICLFLGTIILSANVLIVAVRWWLLLRRLGVHILPLSYAMAATYVSVFVSQVTPGPIGADAMRAWLSHRYGIKLRIVFVSLVADRVLALVSFVMMSAAVWYWLLGPRDQKFVPTITIIIALLAIAAAAAFWLLPDLLGRLARRWQRFQLLHELSLAFRFAALSRAGALGLALSFIVVALTTTATLMFSSGFGVSVTPSVAYLVVPVAILFSSLPISVGGWGVREASLAYGLTLFGVPADDAALVALVLGIGLLMAALPGGIVWLALGKRVRQTLHEPTLADA